MTRHYIPVAAKRRALHIYRDRRRNGAGPLDKRPLRPIDAMCETVRFFEGHLAYVVAHDKDKRVKDLLDGYRAAEYYLDRMYNKPWRHQFRPAARLDRGISR